MTVQQCQEPPAEVELPALAIEVAGKTFIARPDQGPVLIGRALPAQIRITTHAISRTHLRIEPVGQQWVVSDAGTRNGTFCDGERIDAVPLPTPLTESVTFHMGGVDGIAVRIRSAAAVTDTPKGTVVALAAADLADLDDRDGEVADSADSLTGEIDLSVARAGAAVAARREELGLSQRKLAEEHIVSQSVLVRFERGEHWPRQNTLTRIEGYLDWSPGTIARIRAGASAPDAESTEVLSPTVQVAVLIDASEIALRVLLARAAGLPSTSAPHFGAEIAPLLSELRRLERTISGAATTSTGRPEIARLLSQIRHSVEDLAGIAARAPGATLGQRLTAVRTRSRLTAVEVAAASGTDVDTVSAAEAERPLSGQARAAFEQFIAVVGAR
ncbi:FHA domain-containing protein [Mycolicibacterium mageritense DSM 44476 = CIP 104973]|uniref:helix-turn-helix domain-containing protein n=1 Tax=Mycolicibacterium mageritense TaxID=53462 RepID=UPI001E59D85D|nr:helix-turn-helix domain-containing protein [Mycolicibacterium mageritense]MCC9186114.1 helix-turn-helix domain-containing protein [Mycolicibacterium mageritense]